MLYRQVKYCSWDRSTDWCERLSRPICHRYIAQWHWTCHLELPIFLWVMNIRDFGVIYHIELQGQMEANSLLPKTFEAHSSPCKLNCWYDSEIAKWTSWVISSELIGLVNVLFLQIHTKIHVFSLTLCSSIFLLNG